MKSDKKKLLKFIAILLSFIIAISLFRIIIFAENDENIQENNNEVVKVDEEKADKNKENVEEKSLKNAKIGEEVLIKNGNILTNPVTFSNVVKNIENGKVKILDKIGIWALVEYENEMGFVKIN